MSETISYQLQELPYGSGDMVDGHPIEASDGLLEPPESTELVCYGPCNNRDEAKFRYEKSEDDELIGIYCKECNTEWLRPEHLSTSTYMVVDGVKLFPNNPIEPKVSSRFQAPLPKTKITSINKLKKGDHISWERVYFIWHHAIVLDVDEEKGVIETFEWNTEDNERCCKTVKVVRKRQPFSSGRGFFDFDQIRRINYPRDVSHANNTELVLARAKSREGDIGYGPYTNCESFAVYCKTGYERCHQTRWCKWKCLECLFGVCGRYFAKMICVVVQVVGTEEAEKVVTDADPTPRINPHLAGELVSAAILILLELFIVCFWTIRPAYQQKQRGQKTTEEFVEAVVRRLFEAFAYVTLVIILSFVFEEKLNYGLRGGIVGGLIGGFAGAFFGHWIGGFVGKCVARCRCCSRQDDNRRMYVSV